MGSPRRNRSYSRRQADYVDRCAVLDFCAIAKFSGKILAPTLNTIGAGDQTGVIPPAAMYFASCVAFKEIYAEWLSGPLIEFPKTNAFGP